MVGRIARFWQKLPHEIWDLPFNYYVTLRDQTIEMLSPEKTRTAEEALGDVTADRVTSVHEGISVVDYDAVLRQRRKGRR